MEKQIQHSWPLLLCDGVTINVRLLYEASGCSDNVTTNVRLLNEESGHSVDWEAKGSKYYNFKRKRQTLLLLKWRESIRWCRSKSGTCGRYVYCLTTSRRLYDKCTMVVREKWLYTCSLSHWRNNPSNCLHCVYFTMVSGWYLSTLWCCFDKCTMVVWKMWTECLINWRDTVETPPSYSTGFFGVFFRHHLFYIVWGRV